MRRVFIFALSAVTVFALAAWAYSHRAVSGIHVPSGSAVSAIVLVSEQPVATITNTSGLEAVAEMLRSGRPVRTLHECAARGHIEMRFADGQTLHTAFGPGHDASRYEFGMKGHVFTISRSRFLGALRAGGVDVQKIPTE